MKDVAARVAGRVWAADENEELVSLVLEELRECAKENPVVVNGAHVMVMHDSDWPKCRDSDHGD